MKRAMPQFENSTRVLKHLSKKLKLTTNVAFVDNILTYNSTLVAFHMRTKFVKNFDYCHGLMLELYRLNILICIFSGPSARSLSKL